jgi:hypothetical protein
MLNVQGFLVRITVPFYVTLDQVNEKLEEAGKNLNMIEMLLNHLEHH